MQKAYTRLFCYRLLALAPVDVAEEEEAGTARRATMTAAAEEATAGTTVAGTAETAIAAMTTAARPLAATTATTTAAVTHLVMRLVRSTARGAAARRGARGAPRLSVSARPCARGARPSGKRGWASCRRGHLVLATTWTGSDCALLARSSW